MAAAVAAPVTAVPAQPLPATGLGSLEASRGGAWVTTDCGGTVREVRGEIDVRCQPWDPAAWTGTAWKGDAWTGATWTGSTWTGTAWKGVGWSDASWTGTAWKGGTWTAGSWSGSTGWNGDVAASNAWTGVAWKDSSWSGVAWKADTWSAGSWTSAGTDELLTAFWGSTPPAGRVLAGEVVTPLPDATTPGRGRRTVGGEP